MDSKPLQPSSRPRNIRRHSAPARHAPFEFLPNLNNLPEIFVQPPQSAPATPAYEEHDPSLLKPPPFRFSSRTKPLFSPSQPSISLPPVNSHTLPEQPDLSQQQIFTMGGAVYSQEMIRDLVRLVLENAATFFQGFIDVKVLGRLISDFQSLEAELLDLLKFGDPRGYTTAFMTVNENLQPKPRSYATMKYTSDFKRVFRSIQTDASYATFPISNNLIIFARIVRRKLHTRRVGSLEIAELLLEHTENTQSGPGAVEVNVNPSTLLVIGKDMLNSYVEMLSCTRTPMGWSGWYSAKRNNRKANYETCQAQEDAITRRAEETIETASASFQKEVRKTDKGLHGLNKPREHADTYPESEPPAEHSAGDDLEKSLGPSVEEVSEGSLPHATKEVFDVDQKISINVVEKEAHIPQTSVKVWRKKFSAANSLLEKNGDEGIAWEADGKGQSENDKAV